MIFSLLARPTSDSLTLGLDPRVDVSRLDLRVGRILSGRHHPLAERMSVLEVDVGENSPRTAVSNLGKITELEEVTHYLFSKYFSFIGELTMLSMNVNNAFWPLCVHV